jgi:Holliday junction resolvase
VSNRRRGFAQERDLAKKLWDKGFAVMRAPASGSKAKRLLYPDLVAIKNGVVFAFEVKTTRSRKRDIYIPRQQVDKLVEFSRRSGGMPFIAVKIVGEGDWFFIPLRDLQETGSGGYKLPLSRLETHSFLKMDNLLTLALGVRPLREYFEK